MLRDFVNIDSLFRAFVLKKWRKKGGLSQTQRSYDKLSDYARRPEVAGKDMRKAHCSGSRFRDKSCRRELAASRRLDQTRLQSWRPLNRKRKIILEWKR